MELFIFGRFHAREGEEEAVAAALREVVGASRIEAGCLAIAAFRSARDPRLHWVHSRWIDEAAFEAHIELPHTSLLRERTIRWPGPDTRRLTSPNPCPCAPWQRPSGATRTAGRPPFGFVIPLADTATPQR
jgi:quinol monooxygenase YgiN